MKKTLPYPSQVVDKVIDKYNQVNLLTFIFNELIVRFVLKLTIKPDRKSEKVTNSGSQSYNIIFESQRSFVVTDHGFAYVVIKR